MTRYSGTASFAPRSYFFKYLKYLLTNISNNLLFKTLEISNVHMRSRLPYH